MKSKNTEEIFSFTKLKVSDLEKIETGYKKFKIEQYNKIKSIPKSERTFSNTPLDIAEGDSVWSDKLSAVALLLNVHNDKDFRDKAMIMSTRLSQDMVDIEYDKGIYDSLMDYYNENYKKEKKTLNQESKKLVEDLVLEYKRSGFELPEKKREKLKSLMRDLSEVSNNFSKNLNDYQDFILVSEEDAKEIGIDYFSTLEKVNGKYKVDLSYPKLNPFLKYSSNRKLRKDLADKNSRKGGTESLKMLERMVKIRIEISKILGYKNFVDFKVESRMAKSSDNIQKFIEKCKKTIIKAAAKDIKEINTFAKEKLDIDNLEYYDLAFVSNKLYQEKFDLDQKVLREYFEMENTLSFMFKYFGELFGFSISKIEIKTWNKDVISLEIKDKISKSVIGYLLLDLYPREGKYNHMASFDISHINNVNALVCNFTKPTKKSPSLLTPYEVETLFHEFGHALHHVFYNKEFISQNSFSFAWDIVELPSQMLENFFYNESVLKKLSKHYKTGKNLDNNSIKKLISSKNFQNGYGYLRQIVLTELDLDIHLGKVKKGYEKYYKTLLEKYSLPNTSKDSLFPAGFGHLSGYDAGYYSYLFALIYALDVYSVFEENLNDKNKLKEIGLKYRREVLEVGTSREESESINKFLGRKLDFSVISGLFD